MSEKSYFLHERYRAPVFVGDEEFCPETSLFEEQSPEAFSQQLFFLHNPMAL